MYKKELRCWKSDAYDEPVLLWCLESFNRENPEALFILADDKLEKAAGGKETAEAVFLMEKAAALGSDRAALAMAQMFRYGWAVARSRKSAVRWYEKAAEMGNAEAAAFLASLKKQKRCRLAILLGLLVLFAAATVTVLLLLPHFLPVHGILVHEDTELIESSSFEEFTAALNALVEEYDDELVVSGKRSSNRLLLCFEGDGIDLSDFPAAVVLSGSDNYLVIQFDSEEEAQRCLETLLKADGILFVEEDEYRSDIDKKVDAGDLRSTGIPYLSPHTGYTYYSWGVEYLGLDHLAAWLLKQKTAPVTVAVLDTGSEPCAENQHRYLKGYDIVNSYLPNGWYDHDGHGTHVAGTIIDCTWGLDVTILPVRVLKPGGSPCSYIITGLQYAIQSGVDVINMSLGGSCNSTPPNGNCGSGEDYYIREAVKQGIVVVVAAGNGDDYGNPVNTTGQCPAHIDECIVVAACDARDRLGSFSNFGDSVDVCAPGVDVTSYYPGGMLASLNGTSMATPHVSALAAMLKLYMPNKTPRQIEKYITDYCVDMGNEQYYGEGIPWAGYFAGD